MLTSIAHAVAKLVQDYEAAHQSYTMKGLLEKARRALPHLLAIASATSELPYRCATDEDCSLNGRCRAGTCACDPGWTGADCGVLDLRPVRSRRSGYDRAGVSSWGASIVPDPVDAGLHHLFVSEFAHGCGLDYWAPYSRIVRAESRAGAAGPYVFAEEVAGTFAHNPTVVYSPADEAYLMYHIGCPTDVAGECASKRFACGPGNANNGESGISLKVSRDLRAWTDAGQVFRGKDSSADWDADVTNPSAFPLRSDGNATAAVLLAYRGCPQDCLGAEMINIAVSSRGHLGPYAKIQPGPVFPQAAEDPFVFRDARGHWHMLTHSLEPGGEFGDGPLVGRHAYARDYAGPWALGMRSLAFDTTVRYEDGGEVRLFRRERPQLLFSRDGRMTPLLLTTGVQRKDGGGSYTVIVPVGDAGVEAQ